MIVIPAIDIKEGRCVRLTKGMEGTEKVYFEDPFDVAKSFADLGIKRVHIVDLDGAMKGVPENMRVIERICKLNIDVEVGGGIRDGETVKRMLEVGVRWVIMGTIIVEDFERFRVITEEFPGRIIAGVDVRDGKVVTKGWKDESVVKVEDLILKLGDVKIESIIVTDTSKDGTLEGINLKLIEDILEISNHPIIASGGVKDTEDILKLKSIRNGKLKGVIVGKALYEGKIDLQTLIAMGD